MLTGLGISLIIKTNLPVAKLMRLEGKMVKLDLNKIKLEDMLRLPQISPRLAEKIISYRNLHGGFKDLEELKEIKGIGEYRFKKLEDLFYVE